MGVASLVVALGVCLFMALAPRYYDHAAVRFALCVLITVPLTVFFFIFWPQELKLTKIPVIDLSVTIAGPVVLWLILFLLLLKVMPPCERPHPEYFALSPGNDPSRVPYHTGTQLLQKDRTSRLCYPVADPGDASSLKGVVIEFRPGEDHIEGTLQVPKYPPLLVEFRLGANTAIVSEPLKE
jgi:hypothetical protein